ncbi:hypothetical protein TorRG33x02_161120 [Trema orientale]|uniref:Uncharacterized protein n=1 Tax=Trema orientale TaxID=63057 RepID=A0A2P5ERD5_TREOI|nr:hypothetical protein TorRG33x02_161120 [Trema orientale]
MTYQFIFYHGRFIHNHDEKRPGFVRRIRLPVMISTRHHSPPVNLLRGLDGTIDKNRGDEVYYTMVVVLDDSGGEIRGVKIAGDGNIEDEAVLANPFF